MELRDQLASHSCCGSSSQLLRGVSQAPAGGGWAAAAGPMAHTGRGDWHGGKGATRGWSMPKGCMARPPPPGRAGPGGVKPLAAPGGGAQLLQAQCAPRSAREWPAGGSLGSPPGGLPGCPAPGEGGSSAKFAAGLAGARRPRRALCTRVPGASHGPRPGPDKEAAASPGGWLEQGDPRGEPEPSAPRQVRMAQGDGEEKRHLLEEPGARSYLSISEKNFHNSMLKYIPDTSSIELGLPGNQHCHSNWAAGSHYDSEKQRARRKLYIASVICLVFMTGEVIGGYLSHSLAIMTDAAHLLTDFASMMISLFSLWMASRPATKTMNFGWHRAEILGALVSVLSIWVVTGVLVYLAVERLLSNNYEIEGDAMLITSACAVVVNIIMGVALHQSGHGHSHHGHSHRGHSKQGNTSVQAAFIHVVGDLLQSVGVLVAAYIIYFKPEYKYVDPICTFLFSILVLGTTLTILRDVVLVLMEGTPKGVDFNNVKEILLSINGVKALHSLHIWALTVSHPVLSVHIAINENTDAQTILKEASSQLQGAFNFHTTTIQIENYSEDMRDCRECQSPSD
ncbi:unnamed protein product [Eretmochelys imbricata]